MIDGKAALGAAGGGWAVSLAEMVSMGLLALIVFILVLWVLRL